jgi:hypothetical protein
LDAELGLLVARYRAREEEADPQERRRAGFLRQKTGACSAIGHGRLHPLGLLADKVVSNQWNIFSFITNEKAEVTAEVLLAEIAWD